MVFAFLTVVVISSVSAAPSGIIYAAAPEGRGAYHVGGNGVYNYGYNTGDGIAKVEVRHADGTVTGSYRYFDPNGRQILRSYIADKRGFRVLGNDLPVSPETPAVGILDAQVLTAPVEGTREFGTLNVGASDDILDVATRRGHHLVNRYYDENYLQDIELHDTHPQVVSTSRGYYSLPRGHFGASSPYLFADDNFDYDFPAGFAYNALPLVYYDVVHPIGVQGEETPAESQRDIQRL